MSDNQFIKQWNVAYIKPEPLGLLATNE